MKVLLSILIPMIVLSFPLGGFILNESNSNLKFAGRVVSNEGDEVKSNPIVFMVEFNKAVPDLEPDYVFMTNAYIHEVKRLSETTFDVLAIPYEVGSVTITISKYFQSLEEEPLNDSPSVTVTYIGTQILRTETTSITDTDIRFTVTSSGPARFYALALPESSSTPSMRDILVRGTLLTADSNTQYSTTFQDLNQGTFYKAYLIGKEELGTIFGTPISSSATSFRTGGINTGECPTGFGLNNGVLGQVACSGNGECNEGYCRCYDNFSGSNCDTVKQTLSSMPGSENAFIHGKFELRVTGEMTGEMETYIKQSIQKSFSSYLTVPVAKLQFRTWNVFQSNLMSLSRVSSHNRRATAVDPAYAIQYSFTVNVPQTIAEAVMEKLDNESTATLIGNQLKQKLVSVEQHSAIRVALQTTDDSWMCHDGEKNGGESDIDCGGLCATKCDVNMNCITSDDCQENMGCDNLLCTQMSTSSVWGTVFAGSIIVCIIVVMVGAYFLLSHKKEQGNPYAKMREGNHYNL